MWDSFFGKRACYFCRMSEWQTRPMVATLLSHLMTFFLLFCHVSKFNTHYIFIIFPLKLALYHAVLVWGLLLVIFFPCKCNRPYPSPVLFFFEKLAGAPSFKEERSRVPSSALLLHKTPSPVLDRCTPVSSVSKGLVSSASNPIESWLHSFPSVLVRVIESDCNPATFD